MPRIIAGQWKGRKLAVPAGMSTRPTSDRVRESVFTRLMHENVLDGASVLDLFAGSGALALEALSRGASRGVVVDKYPAATTCLQRNIDTLEANVQVVSADAAEYLRRDRKDQFNIVFYDPPYDHPLGKIERDMKNLLDGWLRPDALVIVEQSARSGDVQWPAPFVDVNAKIYGETKITFADTYVSTAPEGD